MYTSYYFCAVGREKTFCELLSFLLYLMYTHTLNIYTIVSYTCECISSTLSRIFFVSNTISKDKPNTLYRNVRTYISAMEDTTFSFIPCRLYISSPGRVCFE